MFPLIGKGKESKDFEDLSQCTQEKKGNSNGAVKKARDFIQASSKYRQDDEKDEQTKKLDRRGSIVTEIDKTAVFNPARFLSTSKRAFLTSIEVEACRIALSKPPRLVFRGLSFFFFNPL